ncbi:c-type cytochrome [Pinibacter soli]|uniref:Cytochrome c n=1 Tax=Pinibacter soli TaxID=3044211 RepID=A0ABT6RE15_9BACT|nr:cytochrome c [Pinibacter soli]MDI3320825.1 cytochrome c [Pinibacter soli]
MIKASKYFSRKYFATLRVMAVCFLFCVRVHSVAQDVNADEGKKLFQGRCASCHNVNKTLTGPALAKVYERHTMPWIISFVKGSQSMVKSGDKEALELFNKHNQIVMPDHPDLNNSQIESIVEYIKTEEKNPVADAAPFARPGKKVPHRMPLSIYNYPFMIGYVALIILMVGVLISLVNIKSYESHVHHE